MLFTVFVIKITSKYPRCKSDDIKHGEYQILAEKEGHGLIGCAGAGAANYSNPSKQFVANTDFHSVPDGLVYGPKQTTLLYSTQGAMTHYLFVSAWVHYVWKIN